MDGMSPTWAAFSAAADAYAEACRNTTLPEAEYHALCERTRLEMHAARMALTPEDDVNPVEPLRPDEAHLFDLLLRKETP